jgi:hypothetical protein
MRRGGVTLAAQALKSALNLTAVAALVTLTGCDLKVSINWPYVPLFLNDSATVYFSASGTSEVVGFTCVLDDDARTETSCTSPHVFQHLAPGTHTVKVTATDAAGGRASARSEFWVDLGPGVAFQQPAAGAVLTTNDVTVEFKRWTYHYGLVPFACQLDSAPEFGCPHVTTQMPDGPRVFNFNSIVEYTDLPEGPHRFTVTATDVIQRKTTASVEFTVATAGR